MLLAFLLASRVARLPAQESAVDRLIEDADRIVVARVESQHVLQGTELQVVELVSEQDLYGSGAPLRTLPPPPSPGVEALESGQTFVLFLRQWVVPDLGKAQGDAPRPAGSSREETLYTWSASWRVTQEHVTIPTGTLPRADGPHGFVPSPGGDEVPRADLTVWLQQRIAQSLPTIRVSFAGSGPNHWSFLVAPDGSLRGSGAARARLAEPERQALWDLLEHERFQELPEFVGGTAGVCTSISTLDVRTTRGRRTVRIQSDDVARMTPADRADTERALRIWRALPLAEPTPQGKQQGK